MWEWIKEYNLFSGMGGLILLAILTFFFKHIKKFVKLLVIRFKDKKRMNESNRKYTLTLEDLDRRLDLDYKEEEDEPNT